MKHLIEQLEARAEHYKRSTEEYRKLQDTTAGAISVHWGNEKNFWRGMWRATETALNLLQEKQLQDELTGGSPFRGEAA
jgi:hypothetical protein